MLGDGLGEGDTEGDNEGLGDGEGEGDGSDVGVGTAVSARKVTGGGTSCVKPAVAVDRGISGCDCRVRPW
jgi:hypothetical protein